MNVTRNRIPKPLKHGGNEEAEEICLIFDVVIFEFCTFINLPFGDFSKPASIRAVPVVFVSQNVPAIWVQFLDPLRPPFLCVSKVLDLHF